MMSEGWSGSIKLHLMLCLARFYESFKPATLPKELSEGIEWPIPHMAIYSGVIAIISFGMKKLGITSSDLNKNLSFLMCAFLISFVKISFSSGFCLKYSFRARLLTSCFLNSSTFC